MNSIMIKRLMSADEFDQAVALQKTYWGFDAGNLVHGHMFHSLTRHGGHLLGAYANDQLVGFVMGFIGVDTHCESRLSSPAASRLLIMSKRMLVLPGHRGKNIGFRLKLAQRDIALKLGIDLVTWTFDPLLAPNAHLNLRKLGGLARRFSVNYFGWRQSNTLKADRLTLQLWVNDRRVRACADGVSEGKTLRQYLDDNTPVLNLARASDRWIEPADETLPFAATGCLIEIPSNIEELEREAPVLARRWREHIRELFPQVMRPGTVVTDFVQGELEGRRRAFYVLMRN